MKRKIILAGLILLIVAIGGFVAYKNTPLKRHARHLIKARMFAQEGNVTAARLEYETAYSILDGYTPWVSLEVLDFNNRAAIADKKPEEALANTRKFVETYPDFTEGRLRLAELSLRLGEIQVAFDQIETVLAKNPNHFNARILLTKLRTAQGRLDLAEEQLRFLSALHPDSVSVILPLSENLLRQGHTSEARSTVQSLPPKQQGLPAVRLLISDSYLFENKIDSAQNTLVAWSTEDSTFALPIAVRRARLLGAQNKAAEGIQLLSGYLGRDVKNIPAFEQSAFLYTQLGQYDSTFRLFEEMAALNPNLKPGLTQFEALLNLKAGFPAKSLEKLKMLKVYEKEQAFWPLTIAIYTALDQSNKIDEELAGVPDSLAKGARNFQAQLEPKLDFIGHWALIQFFQVTNQKWLAFKTAQEWHKAWPKNRMATGFYVKYLSGIGAAKEALRLTESIPDTTLAYRLEVMRLNLAAGNKPKAVQIAKGLQMQNPKILGLNQFLGDIAFENKELNDAAGYYEKELQNQSENLAVINNLAWLFGVNLKDFEKAKPYLDALSTKKILDPRVFDTIGWVYVLAGKSEEGGKYLQTALNLVPDHPTFNFHDAYRLALMGQKDKAKAKLQLALESRRPFPEKASADSLAATL